MTHETETKLFAYLDQEFNAIALQSDMQQIEHIILSDNPSLIDLENDRWEWAQKTFPEATAISSLRKAESEILEIEKDLLAGEPNPEEYADAIMCVLDSAERVGISLLAILRAFALKNVKNKNRTWAKNSDNSYSHVK